MDQTQPTKVLFVEDDSETAAAVCSYLHADDARPGARFDVSRAGCAEEAAATLADSPYDVLLVDLMTRSVQNGEFLRAIQESRPSLPVVVMTDQDRESDAVDAMRVGALEYLIKGRDPGAQYQRALRYAIEKKRSDERARFLAFNDPLTGLPNRGMFRTMLEQTMKRARRHNTLVALLFLDVDRFKWVNESLGHLAGDQLINTYARRLRGALRDSDTMARLGGDEFAIILEDLKDAQAANRVAGKLLRVTDAPFDVNGSEVFITASIGIAIYPTLENDSSETLASAADIALYRAKDQGRNNFRVFTPEMYPEASGRVQLDAELRHAVIRDELVNHYQPKIDVRSGRITGLESLVRWQHPKMGLIYPGDFIKVAEDSGVIVQMGEWVLRNACEELARLRKLGFLDLTMGVNISAVQFRRGNLPTVVAQAVQDAGVPADRLDVELTESILIENTDNTRDTLGRLKDMGVRVSIDDFGTGYSSLAYLQHFPLDALKIDRSFIMGLGQNNGAEAIAQAVISMANALKLEVVAEGVETTEQFEFMKMLGCDLIQGFLFSRPVTADKLPELLKKTFPEQPADDDAPA